MVPDTYKTLFSCIFAVGSLHQKYLIIMLYIHTPFLGLGLGKLTEEIISVVLSFMLYIQLSFF
jgi:hypothetical protein